ncbi:MAG: septum formation family protein [Actinomycetes bacterium]
MRTGLGAGRRIASTLTVLLVAVASLSGCSIFQKSSDGSESVSVFDVAKGSCVLPQTEVVEQVNSLKVVPCTAPHTQEVYAQVAYSDAQGATASAFPGPDALRSFAEGACAQRFQSYVGVAYQDSSLFFTYLLPSARSWEQGRDRTVLCLVTTTGQKLTASVKGSKR